jgi:hypothetical protein
VLVTSARSKATSSDKARLVPWTMLPSTAVPRRCRRRRRHYARRSPDPELRFRAPCPAGIRGCGRLRRVRNAVLAYRTIPSPFNFSKCDLPHTSPSIS